MNNLGSGIGQQAAFAFNLPILRIGFLSVVSQPITGNFQKT